MVNTNNSEIINQKKQFIFEVDQTSDFVFPNEQFNYFIYIKNISGSVINHFTIKIANTDGVIFETKDIEHEDITIQPDEVKLYEMKAYCSMVGKHTVHFIGYGEGTQIIYRTLKIQCTRTYNSDKLLHRINIYNFTPYEENYSMEATNYSNQVTQTFKRQKLPYKSGEQPFPATTDFVPENVESQSFLDQYKEAKNSKEHVYQYLGRENFTEDAIESFTGENLAEIFDKINNESEYFRGKFIKSGTNHLLNDFRQYSPNGFIYRMGLLNSEIYHTLGVIPTYTYMSDRLFRWAPSEEQLLDLRPKKKAMRWDENVWAGRGWIVYKSVTPEYAKTEEFAKLLEEHLINRREIIGSYEEKWVADELVAKLKRWDEVQRIQQGADIVKYEYNIYESLYDTGVFFINIPINKIPSNFYLLDNDNLYALINRTKPYGTKPIVNYIIEKTFNLNMEEKLNLNYHKNFTFSMESYDMVDYNIIGNEYVSKTVDCGGQTITYPAFVPTKAVFVSNFVENQEMDIDGTYATIDDMFSDLGTSNKSNSYTLSNVVYTQTDDYITLNNSTGGTRWVRVNVGGSSSYLDNQTDYCIEIDVKNINSTQLAIVLDGTSVNVKDYVSTSDFTHIKIYSSRSENKVYYVIDDVTRNVNASNVTGNVQLRVGNNEGYSFKNFVIYQSVDYSKIKIKEELNHTIQKEAYIYETKAEHKLNTLENILETLYQGNYNTLSFKLEPKDYSRLNLTDNDKIFSENDSGNITLKNNPIESLKVQVTKRSDFNKGKTKLILTIEDIYNKKHRFSIQHDIKNKMDFVTYTYVNTNNKEFIRQRGYEDIDSITITFGKINNKKVLLFMVEDKNRYLHYFHHVIVQDILSFDAKQIIDNEPKSIMDTVLFANNILMRDVIFETPFVKKSEIYQPELMNGGNNWNNIYRLNNKNNSYAYIKNITNNYLTPDNIYLYYDNLNIPETATIKQLRLKVIGTSSSSNKLYLSDAFNTNYLLKDVSGYKIQLEPEKIECYSHLKESSIYYKTKLDIAEQKGQKTFIDKFSKLLEENYIFNEDINIDISDYILSPNDFITIDNEFWYELFNFSNLSYKLNDIEAINFIIEGYNTEYESEIFVETLSETDNSSTVKKKIPSGYFRLKIPLLYPNQFLLELLRVRFRFNNLNHDIKVFDTKIELKFKNKQEQDIDYIPINEININEENYIILTEDYYVPADINNGIAIELGFDDLRPGDYYQLNSTELEVIYEDNDIDMMVNNNKYQDVFYGINKSSISGVTNDTYLSGLFYDDVPTMSQTEDNTGVENKGIKLSDTLYQMFETRDDNITSIEVFPYGFRGNPDETLKIGLYTNSYNTPGKLIKEVYIDGWVKNNNQLKNLGGIKYNFNVNNLEINEKYWLKIQILNPQENSYYLLKGVNKTKNGFKLLSNENNNYINTFSNLKFNIYSKNLSKSFNNIPVLQEYLDNPYILVGLHKGKGTIRKLQTDYYVKSVSGNDYMSEVFEEEPTIEVFKIIKKTGNQNEELPTEGE